MLRPREADAGGDETAEFVSLGPRHHAKRDLARTQRGDADLARNEFALRRQDRRDRDQILLLDIGIAQRIFEGCQLLAVDADAAGDKDALGKWKHCSSIIRAPA